jgi:hypothetical protein
MSNTLPVLAVLKDAPVIFGPMPLRDPAFYEHSWFIALVLLALVGLGIGIYLYLRRRRLLAELAAENTPERILRRRIEALRGATIRDAAYFGEVASILRAALSIAYNVDAQHMTSAEIESMLNGRDTFSNARPAFLVVRDCDKARFAGAAVADVETFQPRAEGAFRQVLPAAYTARGDKQEAAQ